MDGMDPHLRAFGDKNLAVYYLHIYVNIYIYIYVTQNQIEVNGRVSIKGSKYDQNV